ncbi:MAG: cyclic nucleotide-binding domain-containing protein [Deltaproteobacteria bacterium]|jgi:CRP/FNR family cyclic AMP-dependent transcriptional regulator
MTSEKKFNWEKLLRRHPLFSNLDEAEKNQLIEWFLSAEVSEEEEYAKGSIIITEGDLGDSIFLIGSGSVRAVLLDVDGRESAILSRLKGGDFFGEMALFEAKPRAATIIADEESTILEVKGQEFLKLTEKHPEIELKILLKLSERLRYTNERFLAMKLKNVDEKLQLFNTRLEAELKVIDASLKASQTVFEQTKVRTDEVINSAERSRSRLTVAASAIGGFVTVLIAIFGFLGVKQLMDLSDLSEKVEKHVAKIEQSQTEIEKTKTEVEQLSTQLNDELGGLYQRIDTSKEYLAQNVLIPGLREAIRKQEPIKARGLYQELEKLGRDNRPVNLQLLTLVEVDITTPSEQGPEDYTGLLELIVEDADTPELKFRSYYLLLANMILLYPEDPSGTKGTLGKTFEELFDSFADYSKSQKRKAVVKKIDLSRLEEFFKGQNQEQQELFRRVEKLIPT